MAQFTPEIINRIMGKALFHFLTNIHPDGLAVIDKASDTHVVLFIDKDTNELKIQETTNIEPENDCGQADIITEEDLHESRTLN